MISLKTKMNTSIKCEGMLSKNISLCSSPNLSTSSVDLPQIKLVVIEDYLSFNIVLSTKEGVKIVKNKPMKKLKKFIVQTLTINKFDFN